jgi:hypothetical protein
VFEYFSRTEINTFYAEEHERAKYERIFEDYLSKPINGIYLK